MPHSDSTTKFVETTSGRRLEFQGGLLCKVDGARPEYMDGYQLIRLLREVSADLLKMMEEKNGPL